MIPECPAGLTPAFLTAQLREQGSLSAGVEVTEVRQETVGDGTGMMAEITRLVLSYSGDEGSAPDSLIAKYASANETNRAVANSFQLPLRETRYATDLDPLTSARTPLTYASLLDGDRFLILMEDLGDYDVGSQVLGADLRQTEIAIDELAKLHSAFWNKVDALDWVPGIANSFHADNMVVGANAGWDNMVNLFSVPASVSQYRDQFLAAIPALQRERMTDPVTLVHGDFRMENLLYGNRDDHDDVVIIDWQGPLKARGMFDVALFLGQSTTTEVRRTHERELLGRYREGLVAGGVAGLTESEIWDDYVRCVLYDWVYTAVVAGTLDASNEIAFSWMSKMVERQVAASEDLEVFRFLPG
jgi:hypothetical protein